MTASTIVVDAWHLRREQILVEMSHGTLVADHPPHVGGDGRGPTAGELLLFALDASAIEAVRTAAAGASTGSIASRSRFETGRDRIDGPMTSVAYMSRLRHRLELGGGEWPDELVDVLAAVARRCPVARTMRRGIPIEERLDVVDGRSDRRRLVELNEALRADDEEWRSQPVGHHEVSVGTGAWRTLAFPLGESGVGIRQDHQTYVAGDGTSTGVGPTPNDLLLGALASCTIYFIAHNGRIAGIPIESITARAIGEVDGHGELVSISRSATVTGSFTDAEVESMRFMSEHCYIGESMRRGVPVAFELETGRDDVGTSGPAAPSTVGADADGCDDGACCIPELRADR